MMTYAAFTRYFTWPLCKLLTELLQKGTLMAHLTTCEAIWTMACRPKRKSNFLLSVVRRLSGTTTKHLRVEQVQVPAVSPIYQLLSIWVLYEMFWCFHYRQQSNPSLQRFQHYCPFHLYCGRWLYSVLTDLTNWFAVIIYFNCFGRMTNSCLWYYQYPFSQS